MRDIIEKIKIILLKDWDPIGVNINLFLADEYDSYILQIYNWLKDDISVNELAQNLYKIETEYMSLNGDYSKCHKVAEKLIRLKTTNKNNQMS
ncbi:MAG: hypothetical protein LUH10_03915 [Tannerellaceae bacterium]|nr:hypothetical protein [Tannerellaceae bacterium]